MLDNTIKPSLREAFWVWLRVGCLSFGGPAAQIALMHREVIEERKWLSEQQYLNATSFCMFLPGPEAMQLATYAGWRMHGVIGGLLAGMLFILPGAFIILALALLYSLFGETSFMSAAFLGIKAAVVMIVIQALIRVAKRTLKGGSAWWIAALAFVGLFFLSIPYPLIILVAGLYGYFVFSKEGAQTMPVARISHTKTLKTALIWLALWWLPLLGLMALSDSILPELGLFFSKLAVVTFGGAYAVLSYMAQDIVNQYQWLSAAEMLDGLGLAETTPGPLILVTEFVGFRAAALEGGLWFGVAGALISLWATFIPCFLWIFVGAPYIEWIISQPRLRGALMGISAAVVGVIVNLSLWFALHVFFGSVSQQQYGILTLWQPLLSSIDWLALGIFLISGVMIFYLRWSVVLVIGVSSLLGIAVLSLGSLGS